MKLRESVKAWQDATALCGEAFVVAKKTIRAELEAVGGYATTSPTAHGICHTYQLREDSWSEGAHTVGEAYGGMSPFKDLVAPVHAEVGDRCHAAQLVWRAAAMLESEAKMGVERISGELLGSMSRTPAIAADHVALALLALARDAAAFTCAQCGCEPDERDAQRIRDDLANHPGPPAPVAWHCPRCAPDLELTSSGLAWDVVDVGGSSTEPVPVSMLTEAAPRACLFCEKREGVDEDVENVVPYVIEGPGGLGICNQCVLLCVQILLEDPKPRSKTSLTPSPFNASAALVSSVQDLSWGVRCRVGTSKEWRWIPWSGSESSAIERARTLTELWDGRRAAVEGIRTYEARRRDA